MKITPPRHSTNYSGGGAASPGAAGAGLERRFDDGMDTRGDHAPQPSPLAGAPNPLWGAGIDAASRMGPDLGRALDFAKLSSQTYDWDDFAAAETAMRLFRGIDDVRDQDFSTPSYRRIEREGSPIDWWGGRDQGLDFVVFEHVETGDLVVAFRGTEPLSAEDWVEDVEQAFGDAEQYEQATALARRLQRELEAYNSANGTTRRLSFTGHSLGGGLATAAAMATGAEAIVFNAAGLSHRTLEQNGLDARNARNTINFNVVGDVVSDPDRAQDAATIGSRLGGLVPETLQYGETHWLEGIDDRADFGGRLVPDWTRVAKLAESVLNHAWHVITYQLAARKLAQR